MIVKELKKISNSINDKHKEAIYTKLSQNC